MMTTDLELLQGEGLNPSSLSLRDACDAMQHASSMDELLILFARGASQHLKAVQLYSQRRGSLRGVLTLKNGKLDLDSIRGFEFPMDQPSLISRAITHGEIFIGPAPETGPSAKILAATGIEDVEDVVLLPVVLKQKTFCLLIGHRYKEQIADDLGGSLARLAIEAGMALSKRLAHHNPGRSTAELYLQIEPDKPSRLSWETVRPNTEQQQNKRALSTLPTVEILVDKEQERDKFTGELEKILSQLDQGSESQRKATEQLLALGERALSKLIEMFPGRLVVDRSIHQGPLPRASKCSTVLKALMILGRPAIPHLESLTASRDIEVRFFVAHLLSEMLYPESLDPLSTFCTDSDEDVRVTALTALKPFSGKEPFKRVAANLIQKLGSSDTKTRLMAVSSLSILCSESSVFPLIEQLEDNDKDVSEAVRAALIEITKQDFQKNQKKWFTWWEEKGGLERIEWLIDGLVHKSLEIRSAAAKELEHIRGEPIGFEASMSKKERETLRHLCREWWAFQQWWEDNQMHQVNDKKKTVPLLTD